MNDLSQEARALLRSAAHLDDPSANDRARIKARLARDLGAAVFVAAAASQSAGAATAASPASGPRMNGAWGLSKWLAGAAMITALGASAVVVSRGGAPRMDAPTSEAAEHAQPGTPTPQPSHPPIETAVQPLSEDSSEPAVTPATPGPSKRPVRRLSAAPVAPAEDTLAAEVALLSRAQSHLRSGRADEALLLASEHQRRFPGGRLQEERSGIELIAHCSLGQAGPASAASFLQAHRSSPLAARIRKACELE